jgi:hypothetical protein
MSWAAESNHQQIERGTVLSVFEQPWGQGLPICSLPSDIDIAVKFANGAVTRASVIESDGTKAIIEAENTRWRMATVDPSTLPFPPAGTAGAPTTYWIVQDQVAVTQADR